MTQHDTDEAFVSAAFADLPSVEPSAGLMRRIAELPIIHAAPVTRAWPFKTLWMPLLAGALSAALGVAGGLATLDDSDTTTTATLNSTEPSIDELLNLAWGDDASSWSKESYDELN